MTAAAVDYLRLRAERDFLGERERLPPPFTDSEARASAAERNLRRAELDLQLAKLETARARQDLFNAMVRRARERDGW